MKNFSSFSFWLLAAVFILFVANGRNNVVRGDETAKQKQALIDLYDSTNGPKWLGKDNWLTGDPCENDWYGVECRDYYIGGNFTEVVYYLLLSENGLDGTLPNSLQDLSFLWELKLDSNTLSGTIPPLSKDFESLYLISLTDNLLEGTIPSSLFTLESLERLKLGNNSLVGIIPEFVSQTLNHLELYSNAMMGTIPSLANISLFYLDLYANQFSGTIPAELGEMDGLSYLNLSYNVLTGPIPQFTQTTLQYLLLDSNQLSGTVQNDFTSVFELRLNHNSFTGSLPELKSSTRISQLLLNSNNFNGTIPDYGSLESVFFFGFDLSENNLTGKLPSTTIPTNIMYVQSNRLTGKLPDWLCDLWEFDISDNNFDCDRSNGPKCCRQDYNFDEYECGECRFNSAVWWTWLLITLGVLFCIFLCFLASAYRLKVWPFHSRKSEYISISS